MTWWESVLLGLIQGLTEFLPVSSSGHLVLGKELLGLSDSSGGVLFEVVLHFGTVLSILFVYRERVWQLIVGFLKGAAAPKHWGQAYRDNEDFNLAIQILVTMVPTGIAYVLFSDVIEEAFWNPKLTAGMLIVTGLILLLSTLRKNPTEGLSVRKSFLIGVAQSCALFPGISRSGSTICMALYQNVEPRKAADFSFLMLLPVVIGATVLKVGEAVADQSITHPLILVLGTLVAFVAGILAIRIVLAFVQRGKLQHFAWYCFVAGGLGLILL